MPRAATEDALDQLDRSHRRHDEELAALLEAAANLGAAHAGPADLDAVAGAIAYLERAVPRHYADEEASVFPRLAAAAPALATELARIAAEHAQHVALHARLRGLFDGWGGDVPSAAAAATLAEVARELADTHRRHVAAEDVVLAVARRVLDADALAAISDEMEARRARHRASRAPQP